MYHTSKINSLKYYTEIIVFLMLLIFPVGLSATPYTDDEFKKQTIESMYESYKKKAFPDISTITVEQLLEWQQREKIALVDVRTPEEREVSMIPSAIPFEEFEDNYAEYEDYKVVYYCTIGYRSGIHTKKAQKKNLEAYNLYGGVLAWAHAGQQFMNEGQESFDVHVYGEKWNLIPQKYNPVW